jgi:hypothetical protein
MAEPDGTYVFELAADIITSDRPVSEIGAYHRALAQAAMEAVLDGREGYSAEGVQKGGVGFVRVTVPASVAEVGRWWRRRSVL